MMHSQARRKNLNAAKFLLTLQCCALLAWGCSNSSAPPDANAPTRLKVAYLGLTCEAPIFVAYEQGFFREEGLDVELVLTDWDGLREGLGRCGVAVSGHKTGNRRPR